jgi:hypothetical protein
MEDSSMSKQEQVLKTQKVRASLYLLEEADTALKRRAAEYGMTTSQLVEIFALNLDRLKIVDLKGIPEEFTA